MLNIPTLAAHTIEPLDSLNSLEDLLTESMAVADDLFSLDSLLKESMASAKQAERVKASRVALAKGGVTPEQREAMQQQVREWEIKREWTAAADTVVFERQFCRCCGYCYSHFAGYFQRQVHRVSKVSRWIAVNKEQNAGLPKETKYNDSTAVTCDDCAQLAGYPIENEPVFQK